MRASGAASAPLGIGVARADEMPAIEDLYRRVARAMRGTPADCAWEYGVHPAPEDLRDACAAGDLVCARQDGRPVGALVLNGRWEDYYEGKPWRVDAPGERVGVIHLVASAPDLRGRGIARALVRAAKAEARRRGLAALRLDVFDNNAPARALYASEGFVYLGTYPCRYPEGFTHDTGFMELDLGAADGAARA